MERLIELDGISKITHTHILNAPLPVKDYLASPRVEKSYVTPWLPVADFPAFYYCYSKKMITDKTVIGSGKGAVIDM